MSTFPAAMAEYKRQLALGIIQTAYRGLLEYLLTLRTHFQTRYPGYAVSSNLYAGYMDMSYFALVPPALKARQLKIAVVFLHPDCRFEVWLSGVNRQVQARYWQQIKASGWAQYRLVPVIQGADAVLEHVLVAAPDFSDLPALTAELERGTLQFIAAVEEFFATQPA